MMKFLTFLNPAITLDDGWAMNMQFNMKTHYVNRPTPVRKLYLISVHIPIKANKKHYAGKLDVVVITGYWKGGLH